MKLLFSTHAQIRAEQRGVDVDAIKQVIKNGTKNTSDDRLIARLFLPEKKKILAVVYKHKTKNQVLIITTYYEN